MLNLKETFKEASLGYKQDESYVVKMPNKMFFLTFFLLGLGMILIGDSFYIIPLYGAAGGLEATQTTLYEYTGFVSLASKIAAFTLIYISLNKILKSDYIKTKKSWLPSLIIVLIGFGVMVGITYLYNYFDSLIPDLEEAVNEEGVNAILGGKGRIPYAICIVTLTPFVEEMVFRKLAFSLFKSCKLPRWATILCVASIFALIHCLSEDPTSWLCYYHFSQYFMLSITITLVYAYTNENVYASTLLHILNNAMGLVFYFLG